jgi:hypothetical protein
MVNLTRPSPLGLMVVVMYGAGAADALLNDGPLVSVTLRCILAILVACVACTTRMRVKPDGDLSVSRGLTGAITVPRTSLVELKKVRVLGSWGRVLVMYGPGDWVLEVATELVPEYDGARLDRAERFVRVWMAAEQQGTDLTPKRATGALV